MADFRELATLLKTGNAASKLYCSYLTTDTLAQVVNECEDRLRGFRGPLPRRHRQLLQDVRDDAITELRGRQLGLFKPPKVDQELDLEFLETLPKGS